MDNSEIEIRVVFNSETAMFQAFLVRGAPGCASNPAFDWQMCVRHIFAEVTMDPQKMVRITFSGEAWTTRVLWDMHFSGELDQFEPEK